MKDYTLQIRDTRVALFYKKFREYYDTTLPQKERTLKQSLIITTLAGRLDEVFSKAGLSQNTPVRRQVRGIIGKTLAERPPD